MTRRFQFSLSRLMLAMGLFSVAGGAVWWGMVFHRLRRDISVVLLAVAFASIGASLGLLLSRKAGLGAAFGAMLALIVFGLLAMVP
ncbi:MAG TPA: hypothetical protein VFW87_00145 [Pirellulales bacterium]|nr:hypothetical protein [Pirellulales bacterium]